MSSGRADWSLGLVCLLVIAGACGGSDSAQTRPDVGSEMPDSGSDSTGMGLGLSVTVDVGTGGGTVTSDVDGIDCGLACVANYEAHTQVVLTVSPQAGSSFIGWRNDGIGCGRNLTCTVVMDGSRNVGALFAAVGTAGWAIPFGENNLSEPSATLDRDGNLVVVLDIVGSTELGTRSYESRGSSDILVAKLSPAGDPIWVQQIGGSGNDFKLAIAVDPVGGDVVVAGTYDSTMLDLGGPTPLTNEVAGDLFELFMVRYAAEDGAWRWQKRIRTGGNAYCLPGVDRDGDVLVGGNFTTSIDLGPGPLSADSGNQATYLGKLDGSTGETLWQKKIGDSGQGLAYQFALGVDSQRDFIMGGSFSGQVDLAGDGPDGDLVSPMGDAFVAKFSGDRGALIWQQPLGGTQSSGVASLALGPNDSVTVVAQYPVMDGDTVSFVGHALAGAGTGTELVVGRLAGADGRFLWARRFGGPGHEQGNWIAPAVNGDVVVAGGFTESFTMDTWTVTFAGVQEDSFFAVLDGTDGTAIYAIRVGGFDFDHGVSAAVFERNLYGFGTLRDRGTFLGKTLTAPANTGIGYGFQVTLP